jgi:hypothetical protein
MAELRRLEHIRDLLDGAGYDVSQATLGFFSTAGFTDDLTAARNDRLILAGLAQLYG